MDSSKDYLAKLQYIKEIYSELKKSQDLLSKNIIQPSKHERKKRKFWCKLENTIRDIPLKVRKTDQFEVEIKNGSDSSLKSSSKSQLEKSKHSPTQKIPSVSNYQSEANEDGNNICGISCKPFELKITNDSGFVSSPSKNCQEHPEEIPGQKTPPVSNLIPVKIQSWSKTFDSKKFEKVSFPSSLLEKKSIKLVHFLFNNSTANVDLLAKKVIDQNLCQFLLISAPRLDHFKSAKNLQTLIHKYDIVSNNLLESPPEPEILRNRFVVLRNELMKKDLRQRLTLTLQKHGKRRFDGQMKYY